MNRILLIIFFCFCNVIVLLSNDFETISLFYFYYLLVYLFLDFLWSKKFKFIHVWCIAFLYMILSESFISEEIKNLEYSLEALKLFIYSNNFVVIGYYAFYKKIKSSYIDKSNFVYIQKKNGGFLLFILLLLFCYFEYNIISKIYILGRLQAYETIDRSFTTSIINSLGFILPASFAYYFFILKGKSLWIPFLYSLPVFLIFFTSGTRFYLLFSFLGFIMVIFDKYFSKRSLKKIIIFSSVAIALILVSNLMKNSRYNNWSDREDVNNTDFPTYISKEFFSNEGAIEMTTLLITYFQSNKHLLGESSSFITYFWIPRSIWPEKPMMLGYWLVRKYRNGLPNSHSVTFGFIGDVYADFGYYCLIVMFIFGFLIYKVEILKDKLLNSKHFATVLGAMLYPVLFFFVRDPITSLMNLVGIVFFYLLIKKMIINSKRPTIN